MLVQDVQECKLHESAFTALCGLIWILCLLNLGNKQLKCLCDVFVIPCACLSPPALDLLGQLLSLLSTNLSLFWAQIALITDNNDWDRLSALDAIILSDSLVDKSSFDTCQTEHIPNDSKSSHE